MLFKRLFGIKRSYNVIEKVLGRHAGLGWAEIPLTGLILPYVCAYPKLGPGTFYYVYTFWSRYQELGLISSFDQIILWQESCNSDEQQFYQCQENEQLTTSHLKSLTTTKRPRHDVGTPGPGLDQAKHTAGLNRLMGPQPSPRHN